MLPAFRSTIASVLSVAAAAALVIGLGSDWYPAALALVLMLASAILVHLRSLGAQLFARAVWWSNLAFGVAVSSTTHGHDARWFALMALACGLALLFAERKALAAASAEAGYVPAALRSVLMLLMIFALADAQTFLLFATVGMINHDSSLGQWFIVGPIGIAYAAGFIGLYRLQVWGVFVNLAVSLASLALIVGLEMVKNSNARGFLMILALAHILMAAPVAAAVVFRFTLPTPSPRLRGLGADAVVGGLVVWTLWVLFDRWSSRY